MARKRGILLNYFKPSLYVRTFKDINISQLKRRGIKLVISDLDNTLVPHFTRLPNREVLNFISKVRNHGLHFVIMSNNIKSRVSRFADKAGVEEYYSNARKPFKKVAHKIVKKHNLKPSEVVIIGDQIIMDILVANRLKCESILVQPLVSTDYKMSSFNFWLENSLYKRLDKKNILIRENLSHRFQTEEFDIL